VKDSKPKEPPKKKTENPFDGLLDL
jgi:hypothetical protein